MSDYKTIVTRDLRLCLLRALADQPNYTASEVILQHIAESYGHYRSRDVIRNELTWLEGVSAVRIVHQGSYIIATATRRGLDHVGGLATIDGVNKPGPKD